MATKSNPVFEWINRVTEGTEDPLEAGLPIDGYNPFMTSRSLSLHRDTIGLAAIANTLRVPDDWHFRFLHYTVPKRRRWAKWPKREDLRDRETLDAISKVYEVGRKETEIIYDLLTREQRMKVLNMTEEGGTHDRKKSSRPSEGGERPVGGGGISSLF